MSDYGFVSNTTFQAQINGNLAAAKARDEIINSYQYMPMFDYNYQPYPSGGDSDNSEGNNLDINEGDQTSADCSDGSDDGHISFGETVGSFFKGLVSPITNMFSSPENFIMGALTVVGSGLLIAATGGAATLLLVAAGVGTGVFNVAKGAIGAATAKTDAEAKGAWENIGAGTGMIAGSVAGAKAAAKAAGKAGVAGFENAESMSSLEATKACVTGAGKSFSASVRSFTSGAWKTNLGFGKNVADEPETTEAQEAGQKKKLRDMSPEEQREKMRNDYEKQKINADKQRQAQKEYNQKAKAEYEAEQARIKEEANARQAEAKTRVENGESTKQVKKDLKYNQPKEVKKAVNEAANKAASDRNAARLEERNYTSKENTKAINKQERKTLGKIEHATNKKTLDQGVNQAIETAENAKTNLKQAQDTYNADPTLQNKAKVDIAQKEVARTENLQEKALDMAEKVEENINNGNVQKPQSTSAPEFTKAEIKKMTQRPSYKNMSKELSKLSREDLTKIYNAKLGTKIGKITVNRDAQLYAQLHM